MKYISTRDKGNKLTASQAILCGLASDGGLFVPETFPKFSAADIADMVGMNYKQRAARVMAAFLTDFTEEELLGYAEKAYSRAKFAPDEVAPVVNIGDNVNVLELFWGPTCAFKDFALQMLPFLITASMKKNGESSKVVILTATSGDTGKAALEGFADVDGTMIGVFYPDGGTSNIQKLQMTTQKGGNVNVFGVRGNFDDAQNGVKKIFTDKAFGEELKKRGYVLSSANSINFGRIVAQIAYYFSAYCELVKAGRIKTGDKINVVVPTGNFGNILAAYYAKRCGAPFAKFICASNKNDVLTEFLTTGTYDKRREFYVTMSPSMDILISSNLERLIFEATGRNDAKTASLMKALSEKGTYSLDDDMMKFIKSEFEAGCADDEDTQRTIKAVHEQRGYMCDTHTAVALKVCYDYLKRTGDKTETVVASTASIFKFAKSVLGALEIDAPNDDFRQIEKLAEVTCIKAPAALSGLEKEIERFTKVIDPEKMKNAVDEWLD